MFIAGTSAGACLATLAILTWWLACLKEMQRCIKLSTALWVNANAGIAEATIVDSMPVDGANRGTNSKCIIIGISYMYAIANKSVAFSPGIIILLWINCVGAMVLAMAIKMAELILNAVALEVILHPDEMLFQVLMPEQTTHVIHKLFPFPVKQINGFKAQLLPVFKMGI